MDFLWIIQQEGSNPRYSTVILGTLQSQGHNGPDDAGNAEKAQRSTGTEGEHAG